MSLAEILARGRAKAEARMGAENEASTGTVRRRTGGKVKTNGLNVDQWEDVHVDLPLRLDGSSTGDGGTRVVTINGVTYQTATGVARMPGLTEDLLDDDHIDITGGQWTGTAWRIVKAVSADQKTARRVPVDRVARPAGWDTP